MRLQLSTRRAAVAVALVALVSLGGWLGWRAAQRQQPPVALLAIAGNIVAQEELPGQSEDQVTVETVSGTPIYALSDGVVREITHGFIFSFDKEKVALLTSPLECAFGDGEAFARGDIVAYVPRDTLGLRRPDQPVRFTVLEGQETANYLHIAPPEPEGSHL